MLDHDLWRHMSVSLLRQTPIAFPRCQTAHFTPCAFHSMRYSRRWVSEMRFIAFWQRLGVGVCLPSHGICIRNPATDFLAIVTVHYPKASSVATKGWISVFIGDTHHKMSMHQLDGIYDFPMRRERDTGAVEDHDEF